MADAIVRLKVESQEYDSKLERATQKLQHMEKECRKIGGTFEYVDKEQLDLVKSLGQMETKATTARGKVAEMTKSYTELSLQYKRLSDQEKQSPFGKALSQSLDQLKGRINGLKGDLKDVTSELGDGGGNGLSGVLDAVAGKLGVPVEMFTKLGAAAAGIGAALKVATDALKQNEEFMDEWGRITESATAIYDGFLNALNTGNFSTFFSNMDGIVQSAREAYDALDDLGTFQAFNQINELKARAGMDNAIAAYREGTGSKGAVRSAGANMIAQLEQRLDLQNTAYRKKIEELANTRDVDIELLTKALSGEYGDYAALKELSMPTKSVWNSSTRSFNDVIDYGAATEEQKLGEMLRKFTDDELNALQKLGADAANTEVQIAGVNKQLARVLRATDGKGGIVNADKVLPAGSIAEVKARIAELNKAYEMAGDASTRDRIRIQIEDLKRELEMMSTPMTGLGQVVPLSVELLDTSKEKLKEDMEELRKRLGLEPIKLGVEVDGKGSGTVDAAKQTEKAWGAAANAISAIGGALQQIEDPSAKVAGIIMQAVANIALGFATATTQAAAGGPFAWIAATVAGIANMISAVTAIKQVTSAGKFADGGMVGGNSYSGDNLTASVNSGELILNRAQQNTIASQLQGGAANIHMQGVVRGHDILLAASNYARAVNKHSGAGMGANSIGLPIIAG